MKSLLSSLPLILPIAQDWAEKQELIVLKEGQPLTESETADARRAGVAHPEKIRVARTESLPRLESAELMFLAKQMGLYGSETSGLTMGYAICLPKAVWQDRYRLVHECVHVSQYEKLKGIGPFLSAYLRECIDPGYPFGQMEQEAILVAKNICKPAAAKKAAT